MKRALSLLALGALFTAAGAFAAWRAPSRTAIAEPPHCAVPRPLTQIDAALARTAAEIAARRRLTIVALGSSSTSGIGASSSMTNYPSRLEALLRQDLPGVAIRVVNRGVGGQEVGDEVPRIDRDVLALRPDLAIWQVGTNAVLHHDDFAADERLLRRGIEVMTAHRIDVVLMDLQYAPRILRRRAYGDMEQIIATTARSERIGLFRRFAIMRRWARTGQLEPAAMIAPDGLHMTDASYGCLAVDLAHALVRDIGGPAVLAADKGRSKPAGAAP